MKYHLDTLRRLSLPGTQYAEPSEYPGISERLHEFFNETSGEFYVYPGAVSANLRAIHNIRASGGYVAASLFEPLHILAHLQDEDTPISLVSPNQVNQEDMVQHISDDGPVLVAMSAVNREYGLIRYDILEALALAKNTPDVYTLLDITGAPGRILFNNGFPETADIVTFDAAPLGCEEGMCSVLWTRDPQRTKAPALWGSLHDSAPDTAIKQLSTSLHLWYTQGQRIAEAGISSVLKLSKELQGIPGVSEVFTDIYKLNNTASYMIQGISAPVLQQACREVGLFIGQGIPELRGSTLCSPLTTYLFSEQERYHYPDSL